VIAYNLRGGGAGGPARGPEAMVVTWRALVLTVARDPWVQSLLTHGAGGARARRSGAGEPRAGGLAAGRAIAATGAGAVLD